MQWTTRDYLYVTAECVFGVLSLLGNSLVLVAIFKTRSLRTVTNCFIGSLAAADALVGLIIPPIVIFPYVGLPKDFIGCILVNSLVVLITNISILNLLAVALERFVAVSNPFFYQRVLTVKRALLVVAATWIIAILIGLIPVMGWNLGSDGFQICAFVLVIDLRYMVYLIFFGMTLPLLLAMLVIYIYIFSIVRQQRKRMESQTQHIMTREMRKTLRQQKREARGAKGLAYVIILFAVCWLPIHIMNTITVLAPEKSAPYDWLLVAIVLSHANSFVNPFLYAFSNSKFKYAMKRILCCGRGGLPSDYDSQAESSWFRQKLGTFMSNENTSSATDTRTPTSIVSIATAGFEEELPQQYEAALKAEPACVLPTGPATAVSSTHTPSGDLASRPSSLNVRIGNGAANHEGKTVSDHRSWEPAELGDWNGGEDNAVLMGDHRSGSIPAVNSSDTVGADNVWVTPASQRLELDQHLSQPTAPDSIPHPANSNSSNHQSSLVGPDRTEHVVDFIPSSSATTSVDSPQVHRGLRGNLDVEGAVELYSLVEFKDPRENGVETDTRAGQNANSTATKPGVSMDKDEPLADSGTIICVRL